MRQIIKSFKGAPLKKLVQLQLEFGVKNKGHLVMTLVK